MPVSYQSVFGLESYFSQEDLDRAYDIKVSDIKNSVKNEVDRQLYFEQLHNLYREAQRDLMYEQRFTDYEFPSFPSFPSFHGLRKMRQEMIRNFTEGLQNSDTQVFSSSRTYNEKSLPDGSRVVVETRKTTKDGQVEERVDSYKKLSDGKTEPLEYEQALKFLGDNKLRLM